MDIGFNLSEIKSKDSYIDKSANIADCLIRTEMSTEFANAYNNCSLKFVCGADFSCNDIIFAKFSVVCYFKIEDKSWAKLSSNNTKDVTLPNGFISHLLSISISTLRGYIFAKSEDSNMSNCIKLDLFDTNVFVDEHLKDGYVITKPKKQV